jgi:hypothetical protein
MKIPSPKQLNREFYLRLAWIFFQGIATIAFMIMIYNHSDSPQWLKDCFFYLATACAGIGMIIMDIQSYSEELQKRGEEMLDAVNKGIK